MSGKQKAQFYWWPRCSSCRKVRELLLQKGFELEERDFFKEGFTEAEIRELADGVGISDLFARRSPSLKKMGLADQELSDTRMVELMRQEPRLVRRPIVRLGDKLLIGANQKMIESALAELTRG